MTHRRVGPCGRHVRSLARAVDHATVEYILQLLNHQFISKSVKTARSSTTPNHKRIYPFLLLYWPWIEVWRTNWFRKQVRYFVCHSFRSRWCRVCKLSYNILIFIFLRNLIWNRNKMVFFKHYQFNDISIKMYFWSYEYLVLNILDLDQSYANLPYI